MATKRREMTAFQHTPAQKAHRGRYASREEDESPGSFTRSSKSRQTRSPARLRYESPGRERSHRDRSDMDVLEERVAARLSKELDKAMSRIEKTLSGQLSAKNPSRSNHQDLTPRSRDESPEPPPRRRGKSNQASDIHRGRSPSREPRARERSGSEESSQQTMHVAARVQSNRKALGPQTPSMIGRTETPAHQAA